VWQRVQDDIAIGLAAETVGAADRALAEAIAYTSERIVFDKPVATYQTVRHRLVEMFQQVEMARAGTQFAAWASDTEAPERAQSAAMAASYAAEAGVRVTGDDIQLHGGVGFTWANDAHFLFKRVKQNAVLSGGSSAQLHRLASIFIESA
jgi:alkylation response protein AidB-like acyl-CoA dehydrogenase